MWVCVGGGRCSEVGACAHLCMMCVCLSVCLPVSVCLSACVCLLVCVVLFLCTTGSNKSVCYNKYLSTQRSVCLFSVVTHLQRGNTIVARLLLWQFHSKTGHVALVNVAGHSGAWLALLRPAVNGATRNTLVYLEGTCTQTASSHILCWIERHVLD